MLPSYLGPLAELILRTDGSHLPLKSNDLAAQTDLFLRILRREWEESVEMP
jgi:hypothetical protein